MKNFLLIIFFLICSVILYRFIYGLFTSASTNSSNHFTASNAFPTATPTITPTPTSTPTPTLAPTTCAEYCQSISSVPLGCALNLNKCQTTLGGTTGIQNNSFCGPPSNFCCCQ